MTAELTGGGPLVELTAELMVVMIAARKVGATADWRLTRGLWRGLARWLREGRMARRAG
jgi:hypothetical protein